VSDLNDPLHDDALFVRPPAERTPSALVGTSAGDVHADLVRWHDGAEHRVRRQRIERFIQTLNIRRLGDRAMAVAAESSDRDAAPFHVPLRVMAEAVGVSAEDAGRAAALAGAVARGMGPGASGDPGEAVDAVPELLQLVRGDETLDAANRIGLLLQTCDAVADLVRSALTRPGTTPLGLDQARQLVVTALLDHPPVRVARRFRADGELVTVDIGGRPFGAGPHRCPGEELAIELTAGTVAGLRRARS
jgi:cytochrome P450